MPTTHQDSSKAWTCWAVARLVLTVLVLTPLGIVFSKNIEKYVESKGWDVFLIKLVSDMPDIAPLLESPWFTVTFGIMLTLTVVLWVDYFSRRMSNGQKSVIAVEPKPESQAEPSPPHGYLWMKDAAIELYTYARGKEHLLARFAEEMSGWKDGRLTDGSPDDILDYAATYIVFCKKVPIVGKRAPSNNFEAISFDEVRRCRFVDGAKKLARTHNESIYYVDLAVKKDAFEDVMQNVGVDDGYYGPD